MFDMSLFACGRLYQGLDPERFSDKCQRRGEILMCWLPYLPICSLRSKRFSASSSRKLGREQKKKRNDGGGGGGGERRKNF